MKIKVTRSFGSEVDVGQIYEAIKKDSSLVRGKPIHYERNYLLLTPKGHKYDSTVPAYWVRFDNAEIVEFDSPSGAVCLGQRWKSHDRIVEVIKLPQGNGLCSKCKVVQALKSYVVVGAICNYAFDTSIKWELLPGQEVCL